MAVLCAFLERVRTDLMSAHPRAVPPHVPAESWGWIAGPHHTESSDHWAKTFSWSPTRGLVLAIDVPHRPDRGLSGHDVARMLWESRDPRIGYIIWDGRICSSHPVTQGGRDYDAWEWRPYLGSNPHTDHVHVSAVRDARSLDPAPLRGDEMLSDDDVNRIADRVIDRLWAKGGTGAMLAGWAGVDIAERRAQETEDDQANAGVAILPERFETLAGMLRELGRQVAEIGRTPRVTLNVVPVGLELRIEPDGVVTGEATYDANRDDATRPAPPVLASEAPRG